MLFLLSVNFKYWVQCLALARMWGFRLAFRTNAPCFFWFRQHLGDKFHRHYPHAQILRQNGMNWSCALFRRRLVDGLPERFFLSKYRNIFCRDKLGKERTSPSVFSNVEQKVQTRLETTTRNLKNKHLLQ